MRFLELKKNLKKDYSGMKRFPVAVLGDSATQLIVQAVRGYGYEVGLDLQIFEADYDQIERQVVSQQCRAERRRRWFAAIIAARAGVDRASASLCGADRRRESTILGHGISSAETHHLRQ